MLGLDWCCSAASSAALAADMAGLALPSTFSPSAPSTEADMERKLLLFIESFLHSRSQKTTGLATLRYYWAQCQAGAKRLVSPSP